jgi:hypothetical protein
MEKLDRCALVIERAAESIVVAPGESKSKTASLGRVSRWLQADASQRKLPLAESVPNRPRDARGAGDQVPAAKQFRFLHV